MTAQPGWSIRFLPTGRFDNTLVPIPFKLSSGPIPDRCSIAGLPYTPPETITSFDPTSTIPPLMSRYLTPVALVPFNRTLSTREFPRILKFDLFLASRIYVTRVPWRTSLYRLCGIEPMTSCCESNAFKSATSRNPNSTQPS